MAPPEQWGPPIWRLFHVMAAQLNDDRMVPIVLAYICQICAYLPCPECSKDATDFWTRVKRPTDKQGLIDILYNFHNHVNRKKRKPPHDYNTLYSYNKVNLIAAYNDFIRVYNTRGNMNLLMESFQRNMIVAEFRKFLVLNISKFSNANLPNSPPDI